MQDFIDYENNYRFFTDEKQIKLINFVTSKMIWKILNNDEIFELLHNIDAEITHDILKNMLQGKFITTSDYNEIDTKLIAKYKKDFEEDVKTGVVEDRLKFKINQNKRLISRYEILGIYFSLTSDTKALFGIEKSEDDLINNLVEVNQKLCQPRLAAKLSQRQLDLFETTLNSLVLDIEETKEINI